MSRFVPLGMALAVAAAGLTVSVPTASAGPDGVSAARQTATRFALKAAGFGTRVKGGQLPASSGTTAFSVIGCTNKAGITHKNYEASLTLPSLGQTEGVKTKTWTKIRPKKHEVNAYSRHNVAKVVLGGGAGLTLTAVTSLSRAWHNTSGFHTATTTSIGGLSVGGVPNRLPTPDQPITIPGLATISIGAAKETKGRHFAKASADAINILLIPTDTQVRIAHTAAQISEGVKTGIFRGSSNGTRVTALTDLLKSGPTPVSFMPCQGTKGVTRGKNVAAVDLGGQFVVGAASSGQMGRQTRKKAKGFEQGTVATFNLGAGQLILNGIKGRANVTRFPNGKVVRNAKGTTIGEMIVNGESQAIPDPGQSIEIPGLLKLEARIVKRSSIGINVTAVRITMLDGSGAVINLGQARLYIRRSDL